MDELVVTRTTRGVAVVEMARPDQKNAMSTQMLRELIDALANEKSSDSTGVVITGSGGTFSAGADINEKVDSAGAVDRMRLFTTLYEQVAGFPKTTIAAIAGACVGGGVEVASACDLRVATPSAKFRFPGAQFGIPVGAARLPLLVGYSHARDLLLTARTFDAEEAHRIGFINRLVREEDLESASVELASQIAGNPGALTAKRKLIETSMLMERSAKENRDLVRWQSEAQGLMGDR